MSTATDTMGSIKDIPQRKFINPNLISLKCLLFFFFGGMGCLFPFLPLHMLAVGLTIEEARLVSIISPIVAVIGPLVVAPLADKLATHQGSKLSNGRYLRIMIALVCFLSAVFYSLLLLVPVVEKIELPKERRPTLKFSCNREGASVLQERINEFSTCYNWTSESRICAILLKNCNYHCHPTVQRFYQQSFNTKDVHKINTDIGVLGMDSEGSGDITVNPLETSLSNEEIEWRIKSQNNFKHKRYVLPDSEPPHLCFNEGENRVCHVYTSNSGSLPVNVSFREANNARKKHEWCTYPIVENFTCRIPGELETTMAKFNQSCAIECDLLDPFMLSGSSHTENQCSQVAGDPDMTFWMYITIRSIADIFPTAAVALIDAAIVIATRETSCGRGDVGRQIAFGSLSFAIFGPLVGYLNTIMPPKPAYFLPIVFYVGLMIFASIIALAATGMPLSPPEWWWHTRSGMLAVPMSAVKRYGSETAALVLVLLVLGIFWSAMDSYLSLYLSDLAGNSLAIGVILTVGALPAIFFLWRSEHLVDFCGHSNLLIVAFTTYIVRFVGLGIVSDPWWALISEALELFTLGIMWITAILYMRHLLPRHLTVTAQALPVIAHFCIGRCLGAVVGAYVHNGNNDVNSLKFVYQCMAVAAAIVATLYFLIYHGLLKPRCHAQTIQNTKMTPSIVQGINGNGNYTPLRVYHNEMGRKGQFRY
ncbi:uncharacterized protein SP1173 [Chelonus insularis]|uniref:uncharacterized protein SP1173 n=1 Tax=Chelonus insularis TaxID=460826 RepID=UPI00158881E0|nr:uncharacterized protein LOC118075089 [Chelonus insularis]XP_034952619.1 uncharacterized protein LOC118075089 [Chelonus insularis]XP_034952620.1 uncharacterized protein LOC118075089 [Chelonus insularis]